MITQKFFEQINSALDARAPWEQKQLDFYKLRYTGYGRSKVPYVGAPDVHYPLTDISIDKLKPFFIQQVYGQERLASFLDTSIGEDASNSAVNQYIADDELRFDSEMKQRSNFKKAIPVVVDKMLHFGICVVKVRWDIKSDNLSCVAIDPLHIIVPPGTSSLKDAEWIVHVIRLSESQYRANAKYAQEDDIINKIKGKGSTSTGAEEQKQLDVATREGISFSEYDDEIILWEIYWKKNPSDKTWTVTTLSPMAGVDVKIADDHGLAFTNGVFEDGAHPFTEFTYEAATEGFYSPRGIAEILEPYELSLDKLWNFKLQWMDYNGQPSYFLNSAMANLTSFDTGPGSVRPFGIERDEPMSAPLDFAQEMQMTRALAEDRISVPDLGNGMHVPGASATTQKGQVTATQIRAIVGLSNQSNDLRSDAFKTQLAALYQLCWDIICQFRKIDAKESLITPTGNADQWNKEMRVQQTMALFQILSGRPNVDQDELVKLLLEQNQPELVKRLFRDSGEHTQDEAEREADAITRMLIGFPAGVHGDEDAFVRLQTLAQFVEHRLNTGQPVTPEFATLALLRGQQLMSLAQQQKNPNLPQLLAQAGPIVQTLQQIAQHPPYPNRPLGGGSPAAPGAGPAVAPPAMAAGAAPAPTAQGGSNAAQIANALANLMRAGAQVSVTDVNAALANMGLPPMASGIQPPKANAPTV